MGSRRKRRADRSGAGAAGVSRQARVVPITGKHAAVTVNPNAEQESAAHKPSTDTGKHARVGLVTKQSEDGSFELVYETIDEESQEPTILEDDDPPLWKRKSVMIGGAVALVLLMVMGAVAASLLFGGDKDGDKKSPAVAAKNQGSDPFDRSKNKKDKKPYQYVAPSSVKGKINLDEEEAKPKAPAAAKAPSRKAPELNAGVPDEARARVNANTNAPTKRSKFPSRHIKNPLQERSPITLSPRVPNIAPEFGGPTLNKQISDLTRKSRGEKEEEEEEEEGTEEEEGEEEEGEEEEGEEEEGEEEEGEEEEGEEEEGSGDIIPD